MICVTTMTVLLDSFSWMEFFYGSAFGERVRSVIASQEEIIASTINVFEIRRKYLLTSPREVTEKINYVLTRVRVIPVSEEIALSAAELSVKYRMHATDALIYATARAYDGRLLTGDEHFKGLPGVEFIEVKK